MKKTKLILIGFLVALLVPFSVSCGGGGSSGSGDGDDSPENPKGDVFQIPIPFDELVPESESETSDAEDEDSEEKEFVDNEEFDEDELGNDGFVEDGETAEDEEAQEVAENENDGEVEAEENQDQDEDQDGDGDEDWDEDWDENKDEPCMVDCYLLGLPNVYSYDCKGHKCHIDSCNSNYYDTNSKEADGCECQSDGAELCDGRDNDCDGEIDEGFDVGSVCFADGEDDAGVIVCSVDQSESICSVDGGSDRGVNDRGNSNTAGREASSNDDDVADDEDAEVVAENEDDEEFAAEENSDEDESLPDCSSQHLPHVSAFGSSVDGCHIASCHANYYDTNGIYNDGCECHSTGTERCDGRDNDCDGGIDEGFDIGEVCVTESGREGVRVCAPDGRTSACQN